MRLKLIIIKSTCIQKLLLGWYCLIHSVRLRVCLLINGSLNCSLIFMLSPKFLVQNSSILGQLQKRYFLTDPYSTTELTVGGNRVVKKRFFPPISAEIRKVVFCSLDVSQQHSCSSNPLLIFNVIFLMDVYVAKLRKKFTFLILKFPLLTYDLPSPQLLWLIAFLSGTICVKLLTITGTFIVSKCAHRSSQLHIFYIHSLHFPIFPRQHCYLYTT